MERPATHNAEEAGGGAAAPPKPVAVIDIGTNSIRMAIAEIDGRGTVRLLDTLSREVNLGKDTFTHGAIRKSTMEECVRVLKSYRQLLKEYRITHEDQVRVVATSAVREAENRLAFADRIWIATGLEVEAIEEAEVNRITFLGVQPYLSTEPALAAARTVIVTEVGGGNTELLVLQGGNVVFARTYRLGSLRLRETLDAFRTPTAKSRHIMESHIRMTVEQIAQRVPKEGPIEMVALGGDVRFAASQLVPDWDPEHLVRLPVADFERLTEEMLSLSTGKLVKRYHLAFPDAETLAPALLAYVELARAFSLQQIVVANVNLRDGLLQHMAHEGRFTEEFRNHIIRAAIDVGRKFAFDEDHARHVAELTRQLFAALRNEHQLDARYELLLYLAALLHEIGLYVSSGSHHKHSMYLIVNSEIFGLSRIDLLLTGLVARYARRASPKPRHEGYVNLSRRHRVAVAKMAALLRVADALDGSRSQRVRELVCSHEQDRLVISIPHIEDLSLEQLAMDQKGPLFEEVFGVKVLLRTMQGAGE